MLEASNLVVRFGGLAAVNGLSFNVEPGTIVGLIGPNGAGKSTVVSALSGYQRLNEGRVLVEGQPISGLRPNQIAARGLVRTFQQSRLFGEVTVAECLLIAQHLRKRESLASVIFRPWRSRAAEEAEAAERATAILARIGLAAREDELAGRLPYGEQRMLSVGIALAANPKLMLLDEPTAGMNQREKESVLELLTGLRRDGLTILLIEHDMRLVMELCDRIVVLHHGEKIADGGPSAIRKDPKVVDAYLGRGFSHA